MTTRKLFNLFYDTDRYLWAIVFGLAFVIMGYFAPRIYYEYIDSTNYITVKQPVGTNKKIYQPCEEITFVLERNSMIDSTVVGQYELILVKADSNYDIVREYNDTFIVNKDARTITQRYKIPCQLEPGTYFIRGLYIYNFHDVQHQYPIVTDLFTVQIPLP